MGGDTAFQVVERTGKFFCGMNQKAQAILGGLPSIFGKFHGKFWCDTPPEPSGVKAVAVPNGR